MRAVVAANVNGACFSHVRLMNKWFSLCSVHFPLSIRVACDALLSSHCPCCVHCYGSSLSLLLLKPTNLVELEAKKP